MLDLLIFFPAHLILSLSYLICHFDIVKCCVRLSTKICCMEIIFKKEVVGKY